MSTAVATSPAVDIVESQLRYGACEVVNWNGFSAGAGRERIWANHRLMGSEVIRIHAFERGIPDPIKEWPAFAVYVEAVLNSGATPMVTFARSSPPFDSTQNRRWFANRCGEVVWQCIERWGEQVRQWHWSVWSKPNSSWDNPGMSFEHYRAIYEEVARRIVDAFGGLQRGERLRIGGPAIDGFQPFWFDWIWRFIDEVDPSLVGFVAWHRYSDWRAPGEWRSAPDAVAFSSLVMSRTSDYWSMARAVKRAVRGRDVLNVCGELNAHAHYDANVAGAFNQGAFGAAYYAASLLQLIRGGADLELRWSGSDAAGGSSGVMDSAGRPNAVFFAKTLVAHLIPRGSKVRIASGREMDIASVDAPDGNAALFLIHKQSRKAVVSPERLGVRHPRTSQLLMLGSSPPTRIAAWPLDDRIEFDGYGIAVVTARIPAAVEPCVAELAG